MLSVGDAHTCELLLPLVNSASAVCQTAAQQSCADRGTDTANTLMPCGATRAPRSTPARPQAVRELVRRHFGSDGGAPLELPLISRLYVMSPPACHASSHPGTSSSSSLALHTRSHHGNGNCSHGRCSCKHTYA